MIKQHRYNRLHLRLALTACGLLLGLSAASYPARSQELPEIDSQLQPLEPTALEAEIDRILPDTSAIANTVEQQVKSNTLGQLLQGNVNLFDSLKQTISSFINNIQIPDFGQIVSNLFSDNKEETASESDREKLAGALENKPNGSYAIQEDAAEQDTVRSAQQIANDATLSENARQELQQLSAAIAANVENALQLGEESQQLGTESQGLDVSQQILQNLSQQAALSAKQTALSAERQGIIIQQNQQARVDRAMNNLLNAQQAKELSEANTAKRRENASAGIAATAGMGLIRMPGLADVEASSNAASEALDPQDLLSNPN